MTTPSGWSKARLGDLAVEVRNGISAKPDASAGVPILRISAVRPMVLSSDDVRYLEEPMTQWEPYRLIADDLLFTRYNGNPALVGACARVRGHDLEERRILVYPDKLIRVRVNGEVASPAFVERAAHSEAARAFIQGKTKTSAGQVGLSGADLKLMPIALPPLNEQRRIVAKLDSIFEQTRAAKVRLERLPALIEKFKRYILAAALRGDLTADWRAAHPDVEPASALLDRIRTERRRRWEANLRAKGRDLAKATYEDPAQVDTTHLADLPQGWAWASVDDVSELQLGQQRAPVHANAEETYPYIRAANIKWSGLDLSDVKRMGFPDPQRYLLRAGDVLLSEASGSPTEVGKSAIWRNEIPNCCYQKTLLRARPRSPEVSSEWLHTSFLADAMLGRFARMAPGVGILHLTADRMLPWPIPVAPAVEQSVIIQCLQLALGAISRMERVLAESLRSVEHCEQAALARAFRGELVPQDSKDEPAAVLLDRIRAARADAPQSPCRGRDQQPADVPTSSRKSNGHSTTASRNELLDLVIAALQGEPHLTAADIADATSLDAKAVKQVLKTLVTAGQVRVHGKARGTAYEWIG